MKKMWKICMLTFACAIMFTACAEEDLVLNAPSKPDSEQSKQDTGRIGNIADEFDKNNEVER